MELTFEWDEKKAQANFGKHEVSFEEAKTAFGSISELIYTPDSRLQPDPPKGSIPERRKPKRNLL